MEAMMPLDEEILSLRVLMDVELEESEWTKLRFK
jgi:hypothetical protein